MKNAKLLCDKKHKYENMKIKWNETMNILWAYYLCMTAEETTNRMSEPEKGR